MSKSAFGVDHGEISKLAFPKLPAMPKMGAMKQGAKQFGSGFKGAAKKKPQMGPQTKAGTAGTTAGNKAAGGMDWMKANPIKSAGVIGGGGLLTGGVYGANRNKQKGY